MKVTYTFNELSLSEMSNPDSINNYFHRVISYMKITKGERFPSVAYHSCVLTQLCLNGKTLVQNINDSNLGRDNIGLLLSSIQEVPFLEDLQSIAYPNELYHSKRLSLAGGYAHSLNGALFSIPGHSEWDKFEVKMDHRDLDTSGLVLDVPVMVNNLGDLSLNFTGTWLEKLIPNVLIESPQQLLELIDRNCCNVILSQISIDYIKRLGGTLGILNKIYDSCTKMQEYCVHVWKFGELRKAHLRDLGLIIKDESDPTMDKYGYERDFTNQDGNKERFRLHFNIDDGDRAYISGISTSKKIYIAYMGRHLRTHLFN